MKATRLAAFAMVTIVLLVSVCRSAPWARSLHSFSTHDALAADTPPVLSVPIVDLSGTYNPVTRRLGRLDCNYSVLAGPSERWCFSPFGASIKPGVESPSYDYRVVAGASVFAATAGTVTRFEAETNPLLAGDFEIETRSPPDSIYSVIYDHVRNPKVGLGSVVAPGDVLGVAGLSPSGGAQFGRVELQINKRIQQTPTIQDIFVCPQTLGTASFNERHEAARLAHNGSGTPFPYSSVCVNAATECSYILSGTDNGVHSGSSTGSVGVTTRAGCPWTAASDVPFITMTSAPASSASGTVQYSVAANSGAARIGTMTIAGQPFTVTQSGAAGLPTMRLTPGSLNFGVVKSGATLTAATGAQSVAIAQTGGGPPINWAATTTQGWLTVSPASGSGTGAFSVSLNNTFNELPASGVVSTFVTIALTGAADANVRLIVSVTVFPSGTSPSPIGSWDTPLNGAAGQVGSIPITGWALDETDVGRVRLYRAPVGSEPAGVPVYLGDAVRVAGARPDIESRYGSYPRADRAGWGYLLLTNLLPGQGNGTYTLSATVEDADGHVSSLGSRTIICANSTATKPFGAIDTPAQGGTVSGTAFLNFGWVLTPLPKSIATDGSTIAVYVDGVRLGTVTYNNFRADIASLFPGFANTPGAIGFRSIDTTTLTNGVHTISWGVTDSAGVTEGIGSRYFSVQNAAVRPELIALGALGVPSSRRALVRRGVSQDAPLVPLRPDSTGTLRVAARLMERIEVHLGDAVNAGSLVVNGELRAVPIGSHLDRRGGIFYWQPGVGFAGRYDLVFDRAGRDSVTVRVDLH